MVKEMVSDYHALTPLLEFAVRRYFSFGGDIPKETGQTPSALMIDPQARFASVLREFGQYTVEKIAATPRFSGWRKRLAVGLIRSTFRCADALARMVRIR